MGLVFYDIHHMQPREYGGTNYEYNLMPVERSAHNKITGWFNGY